MGNVEDGLVAGRVCGQLHQDFIQENGLKESGPKQAKRWGRTHPAYPREFWSEGRGGDRETGVSFYGLSVGEKASASILWKQTPGTDWVSLN